MRLLFATIASVFLLACQGLDLDPAAGARSDPDLASPQVDAGPSSQDAAAGDLEFASLDADGAAVPGPDAAVDGEADAGSDAGVPSDAEVSSPDAGGSESDAGALQVDAGDPPADAGALTADAAVPTPDAAAPAADAGFPLADGGDPQTDAGDPQTDAGDAEPDVGAVSVPEPGARVLYPSDRTHSPLTAEIVTHLRSIADNGSGLRSNVFMKVGDSITVNSHFMGCFDGNLLGQAPSWEFNVLLDGRSELAETILHFRSTLVGGSTSFARASLAAQVGAAASFPLSGNPQPLQREFDVTLPRYAVVMYGSNDIGLGGSASYSLVDKLAPFEAAMRRNVDDLMARGVVPVVTTMPPRLDDPQYAWIVPNFTAVQRAIAQGRQVPLVDLNRELMALPPPHGIGGDGVHPTAASYNSACWFRPADLTYGYNVRNLVTLEALHQLEQIFVDGASALDPAAPTLAGRGSADAPFVVGALPFTDLRDSRQSSDVALASYASCAGPAAPGPEVLYQLVLARTTRLRAIVLDQQQNRVGVSLLRSPTDAASCLASAPRMIATTLAAGTYYLAVDTLGTTGAEYTLTIVECDPADPRCG